MSGFQGKLCCAEDNPGTAENTYLKTWISACGGQNPRCTFQNKKITPPSEGRRNRLSILFLHDLVLVVELKVMAALYALGEEALHLVLVKIDRAVVAELLVGNVVRALFAAISHHLPPYLS